eukprot:1159138-Pelagomonas_calceolata.AAC.4
MTALMASGHISFAAAAASAAAASAASAPLQVGARDMQCAALEPQCGVQPLYPCRGTCSVQPGPPSVQCAVSALL